MADTKAVTTVTSQQLDALGTKRAQDVSAIIAQIQAATSNNYGGGGNRGSYYNRKGIVEVSLNKNGTFTFDNPFTGDTEGNKRLGVVILMSTKFQLQRWYDKNKDDADELGIDPDKQKRPLCTSVQYEEPAVKGQEPVINESGWFFAPAGSAYQAAKMFPTLTGDGGYDGKQGLTLCSECPMAQKDLAKEKKLCKPTGMLEMVIFRVGDRDLEKPVHAFLKLSVSNIVAFSKYVQGHVMEEFGAPAAQLAVTYLKASKEVDGNITWAKIEFMMAGRSAKLMDRVNQAIEDTEAIVLAQQAKDEDDDEDRKPAAKKAVAASKKASGDDDPFGD